MSVFTEGQVAWNSLDDNTRLPLSSELETGYPCGEADQQLFNFTASYAMSQIYNVLIQSGIAVPDPAKLLQLARAIQSQKMNYAIAGGTANAITASLTPTPSAYSAGMTIRLLITATNTGAATLNVNGLGAIAITTMRGAALGLGDLYIGSVVTLNYTGSTWVLAGIAYSEVPIFGNTTIYVRTDGSDSNDGSANNSAHALLTIGAALAIAQKAASGSTVTIQLGNTGTWAERIVAAGTSANILIKGDPANPANYNIAAAGAIFSAVDASGVSLALSGVRVVPSGTVSHEIYASNNAIVTFDNCQFSSTGTISGGVLTASVGAAIIINAGNTIFASAGSALNVNGGTIALNNNLTVGTPTYSGAFATASNTGAILRASTAPTISGSATGTRYSASMNGIIQTNGAGANYFPGTVAGTTATGGQYA
jgi:hypothetical protein